MKSDKELLDAVKTRDELRRRGFTQVDCPTCNGSGVIRFGYPCSRCGGKGYEWEAPLMS